MKFRRQQLIRRYFVDFVCFEKRVIIEADGGQHSVETQKDKARDEWFYSQGFKVLRFWNNEVLTNPLTPPIKGGGLYPLEMRKSQID